MFLLLQAKFSYAIKIDILQEFYFRDPYPMSYTFTAFLTASFPLKLQIFFNVHLTLPYLSAYEKI